MVFYHLDLFLTSSQEEQLKGCRVTVSAKHLANMQFTRQYQSLECFEGMYLVSQFGENWRHFLWKTQDGP